MLTKEKTIGFLKDNWQYLALVLVLCASFYLRYMPFTANKYLNLDDPYYLYKMSDFYVRNGFLPEVDYQSYYPVGRPLGLYSDQSFLYVLVGWIKILGSIIDPAFTTYQATFLYPPIFGALQVIPMFLLVLALTKSKTAAILATAFYGILPASLSRTLAGFGYKEGFGLFFFLFAMYFFVEAFERKKFLFSVLLSGVSGFFLFLMGITWGGVQMGQLFLLLLAFSAIMLEMKKPVASTALISCFVSLVLGLIPKPHVTQVTILSIAVFVLAIFLAKRFLHRKLGVLHVAGLFLILFLIFPAKMSDLVGRAVNFNMGSSDRGLASTVAQNKLTDWSDFERELGLVYLSGMSKFLPLVGALFISIAGAAYLLYEFLVKEKRIDELKLFMIVFFIYSFWFGKGAIRLVVATSIGVSIVAGYFLWKLLSKDRSIGSVRIKGALFSILVAASLLGHLYVAYGFASTTRTSMDDYWQDGLSWIGSHSGQNDVVFSWWDYGYIIQVIANRTSVIDPRNLYIYRDTEAALFLTAPNESAPLEFNRDGFNISYANSIEYLRFYNVSYIIMDAAMIGKYSAVSKIAAHGDSIGSYLVYSYSGGECLDSNCSMRVANFGPRQAIATETNVSVYFTQGGARIPLTRSCEDISSNAPCSLLTSEAAVTAATCFSEGCSLTSEHSRSIFFQLWFLDARTLERIKLVYQNPGVKVYKVDLS